MSDALISKRMKEIMDLQFLHGNALAVYELYDYCKDRRKPPESKSRQLLIKKGILNPDGTIPYVTNDAMYVIRTGKRPPWLGL